MHAYVVGDASQRGFSDPRVDTLDHESRSEFVLSRVRAQIAFIEDTGVRFWNERLQRFGIDRTCDLERFRRLPPLTKRELRALAPWDIVPEASRKRVERCFG